MRRAKTKVFHELSALKGLIREKGTSYRKLAEQIGIALNTFSDKTNGFSSFNSEEIDKIVDELDISVDKIGYYFFPNRSGSSIKSA